MFNIAITGTSAAGKSTFARELANAIPKATIIEINDIANARNLFSGKDKFGTKVVKLKELSASVKNEAKKHAVSIIVGHLAPELYMKYDIGVVVRESLFTIAKRQESRKYPREKIRDNLVSEALDYCGIEIERKCKEVYEVGNVKERTAVKRYLIARSSGKSASKPSQKKIDNFKDLGKMIMEGNKYGF